MQHFEYKYGDLSFNNYWQVALFEKQYNTFVPFVTDLTPYKEILKDKNIDENYNYELTYLKQLRSTHKYLRLFYSGGSDSKKILQLAVDNDIFIDEVVSLTRNLYNKPELQDTDAEIRDIVIPELTQYSHNVVGKFTLKNYDAEFMRKVYSDPGWMFNVPGGDLGFRIFQPFGFFKDSGSDCQILGKEKPHLIYYNNCWYATFIDNALHDHLGVENHCFFYLEPENIKSFVKEARKFRTWIESNVIFDREKFRIFTPYVTNSLGVAFNTTSTLGKNNSVKSSIGTNLYEFLNKKDKLALNEAVQQGDVDLISKWGHSIQYLVSKLPDLSEEGLIKRNLPSKFPWLIDIDSLEIFSQQELIPNGFE